MEPQIVSKPAFIVVGLNVRSKNENNEAAQVWEALMPRSGEIKGMVNPQVGYGVCGNYDQASGEFDYLAGMEVSSAVDIPDGMVEWDIPASKYAVFACTLPTIGQAYDHAYKIWLPASGYQHADGPEFELYDESFDPQDPSSVLYIYIPIQ